MIAIQTMDGELVKVLQNGSVENLGFHKLFGFIGVERAERRIETRQRQGFEFNKNDWHCKFHIGKDFNVKSIAGCELTKLTPNEWKLSSTAGDFKLLNAAGGNFADGLTTEHDSNNWLSKVTEYIILAIFLVIPLLYFLRPAEVEEVKEEKKVVEAVTVKVVKPVNTVKINQTTASHKIKPLTKTQKSKRAVRNQLSFLGLVGSKDLKKAVGGVPQKLEKATAGAGKGGDAGSGGEVLTGLGKGLKKTTVGNTGVAGLGGVGTKGAGGGAGGYGNTTVASGEGVGVSSIAVSSNDMLLEGGLSRYAINATIAKYLSQVRRCYESQLNKQPGLEGLVTVSFQINGTGMLNFSKVKNTTLRNATVEKCITTKMMSWKFPKPKGGVNVNINYPFMLRPVGT